MRIIGSIAGEEGQGLTEYGLILFLFVVAVVWALIILSPKITNLYSGMNNQID